MDFEVERENVGAGWQPIVDQLHKDLLEIDPEYEILQIKEKFGELRYYIGCDKANVHDKMEELIEAATVRSRHTCEQCGAETKSTLFHGWYVTNCEDCLKKREASRQLR